MNMNPYASSSLPPEPRFKLSISVEQIVSLILAGVLPLLSTIIERRVSHTLALSAFVLSISFLMIIHWMSPRKNASLYEVFLVVSLYLAVPWLIIAVAMLEIRTNFGYITYIGQYLNLNLDWIYCLLGYSFAQFAGIGIGLQLTRIVLVFSRAMKR